MSYQFKGKMIKKSIILSLFATMLIGCNNAPEIAEHSKIKQPDTVKVGIIGGMVYSGLWAEVSTRFEAKTGYKIELVKSDVRPKIIPLMETGAVDLLTMHSGDITTNLVADGHGINMRPWTRNGLVIWGPKDDPAGIRGLTNGSEAMKRIAQTQSNWIDFRGIGSREMSHTLWKNAGIKPQGKWVLKDTLKGGTQLLKQVAKLNAYIVTGRMPGIIGRWQQTPELEMLVDKDPYMNRPYIVVETNPVRHPGVNYKGARALSEFLFSSEIQAFLLTFDGKVDDGIPLFYPVWPNESK